MAKMSRLANAFAGHWRIAKWTTGHRCPGSCLARCLSPSNASPNCEIAFAALKGSPRSANARVGSARAEFSWEGHDENDPSCGRGWAMIGGADRLVSHFYIHKDDDSGFVCERGRVLQQPGRRSRAAALR
jgi:hypothetical protein